MTMELNRYSSENAHLFNYWILEREKQRKNKESMEMIAGSTDPILKKYHFCNVRREDDRGTKELRAVVLRLVKDKESLPWAYTLARLLNRASSLETLLLDGELGLKRRRAEGGKIFHTAYVVSTCGLKMDKITYINKVADAVLKLPHRTSCEGMYNVLRTVKGLGSFLAGQIVADLKNDRYLVDAPDKETWSCIGPGSKKGLEFIFSGLRVTDSAYGEVMAFLCNNLLKDGVKELGLHRQDLQNCLCEFSKYMQYRTNYEGRKRYYVPNRV